MTDRIGDITKAVVYGIITAIGDDGLEALLTADDLLACMAVPVTQFDFTYVDKGRLNKLMLAVYDFLRKSVSRYWSTAMTRGRVENGLWVWEPRPELMEAAEIVLSEEKFPLVEPYMNH